MKASAQLRRVRLNVESLESRELPAVSLSASLWTRSVYSGQTATLVRYVTPTSGIPSASSGTVSIIGILVAL
jgi:hypothetical protein